MGHLWETFPRHAVGVRWCFYWCTYYGPVSCGQSGLHGISIFTKVLWQNGRLQIVNPASHNRLFHLFWSLHCSIGNMLNHMKNICGATRHGVPMVPRGFPGFPGFPVSQPSPPLKTLIQTPGASDSDWPISFSETVGELEHHHFYQVNHDKP